MGEGSIFHFEPKIFLYQSFNFICLVIILHFLLFKPLGKLLARRKEGIENDIREAEKLKEEAKRKKDVVEEEYRRLQEERDKIITAALTEVGEKKEKIINSAKEEANKLLLQATLEIERAKKQAKEEINKEAVEIACLILKRILQEEGAASLIKEITSKQIKNLPETLPK